MHIKPATSGVVLALALTVASPRTNAGLVTLDFNGGTASTAVGSDFAASGVVFKALTVIDPQPPEYGRLNAGMPAMPTMGVADTGRSGNLPPSDPNADTFNIFATFTVPVDSVSMEVWTFTFSSPSIVVTLSALDANGAVLGSTTVGPTNPSGFNGFKGIATISGVGTIASFLLQTNSPFSETMGIDNLMFNVVGTSAGTPVGSNVMVNIGTVGSATIALTFPQVTVAGTTTVTPIDPNSAGTLPSGYQLAGSNLAFQITTTATYTTPPPIIIAFQVPPSLDVTTLRILHNEGGTLVDRTASNPAPNPTTQTIYASVSSLSPFVIAKVMTPTDKNQCKNGGWQTRLRANGTRFKNQGDCIQYVNTGK